MYVCRRRGGEKMKKNCDCPLEGEVHSAHCSSNNEYEHYRCKTCHVSVPQYSMAFGLCQSCQKKYSFSEFFNIPTSMKRASYDPNDLGEKYRNDPDFHRMVDAIVDTVTNTNLTLSELRQALDLSEIYLMLDASVRAGEAGVKLKKGI